MKKTKNKYDIIYIIPIIISIFILIAFLTINYSYAKYVSQSSLIAGARVAKVVIDVEESSIGNVTELTYRNDTYEYYFTVSNTKDDTKSEVVVEYYVSIDDNGLDYIEKSGENAYKLYRIENDGTRTLVNTANGTTTEAVTLGTATVGPGNTITINAEEHNYVLVYYPISVTVNTNGESLFKINVAASQI